MRINVKNFALTLAFVWAFMVLTATWMIMYYEGGATYEPTLLGKIYWGYNVSFVGSLIGAAWSFFDFLIVGTLFAWLYNLLNKKKIEEFEQVYKPIAEKAPPIGGDTNK